MPIANIPRLPFPFPHMMNKKAKDGKFSKFMAMLKQFLVNIPLIKGLEQHKGYAKFMKDLVTRKRTVSYELVDNLYRHSSIATRSLV